MAVKVANNVSNSIELGRSLGGVPCIYIYIDIHIYIYIYIWYPPIDLGFCCASCPETNSFREFGSKNFRNYW